ncbi:MAG: cobalamin B12-binding domain-containing protein [Gaiellales bacterium]
MAEAKAAAGIDPDTVEASEVEAPQLGFKEVNDLIEHRLRRRVVVVGAAIETDAHTVGIDAIMNMKGFAGDYGLERYPWIEAVNLGAQVPCERLLREAVERSADAILVSQVVTQKQVHARQLTKLADLLEAEGLRDRFLLVCGGPRLSNTFAKELGYDAGFGAGSAPSQVAAWIATELVERAGV